MGLGNTAIYGGIPGDIVGIYSVEAPPPTEHVSGMEGTGYSLEDVAAHVFKTQLQENAGLAGEWTRLAGENAGEQGFVAAYTEFMKDAGTMYREQPELFDFLKEQVFLGRDYTSEWSVDQMKESVNAIIDGWAELATKGEDLSFDEQLAVQNGMEAALAELAGHAAAVVTGASLPAGCTAVYDPGEGSIVLEGGAESAGDLEAAVQALVEADRHAYQIQAIAVEGFHPIPEQVSDWTTNWEQGYRDAESYGYEIYTGQPLEQDAIRWSERVMSAVKSRAAG